MTQMPSLFHRCHMLSDGQTADKCKSKYPFKQGTINNNRCRQSAVLFCFRGVIGDMIPSWRNHGGSQHSVRSSYFFKSLFTFENLHRTCHSYPVYSISTYFGYDCGKLGDVRICVSSVARLLLSPHTSVVAIVTIK